MKIIAVTSCPTGIAHTYMAAEALEIAAKDLGYEIKIETQGAVGIENNLSENDIYNADAIIIAADKEIDKSRFKDKKIYQVSTSNVIKDAKKVIKDSIVYTYSDKKTRKVNKEVMQTLFKHFMAGISVMVPFLIIGAVLYTMAPLALFMNSIQGEQIAKSMRFIADLAYKLSLPALAAYIAFSISNIPALAPGMICGLIVVYLNGGFLGAMVIGFIAGYVVKAIRRYIRLPKDIEGFGIIFIIPVLTTFVAGIIYSVVLMRLFYIIQNSIIVEFADIKGPFAAIIGVLLGSMMAYDMGGPINKLAYVVGLLTVVTGETSTVMAAIMAAGMTPPLVTGLATLIGRRFFNVQQKQLGKLAILKGLVFITEGAIPFAQASPKTVLPSVVAGSAISGGLSMLFGCYTMVPQGGIAAILIPDMVHKPLLYLFSIIIGTLIGAVIMLILKYRQKIKSAASLG